MKTATLSPIRYDLVSRLALAGAALCAMSLSTPALAGGKADRDVVINIGKDGDLLEQLIELDEAGIEEMRAEIADARVEIAAAIGEIEEAREEVDGIPGARIILKIAFASARAGATAAVDDALTEARVEIDKAEVDLKTAAVSAEERAETQYAIKVLRTELDALEDSLASLMDALRA
jgi:chromosome segregation ATPase